MKSAAQQDSFSCFPNICPQISHPTSSQPMMFVWSAEKLKMKEGWKSSTRTSGGPSATTVLRHTMHTLSAINWDTSMWSTSIELPTLVKGAVPFYGPSCARAVTTKSDGRTVCFSSTGILLPVCTVKMWE